MAICLLQSWLEYLECIAFFASFWYMWRCRSVALQRLWRQGVMPDLISLLEFFRRHLILAQQLWKIDPWRIWAQSVDWWFPAGSSPSFSGSLLNFFSLWRCTHYILMFLAWAYALALLLVFLSYRWSRRSPAKLEVQAIRRRPIRFRELILSEAGLG